MFVQATSPRTGKQLAKRVGSRHHSGSTGVVDGRWIAEDTGSGATCLFSSLCRRAALGPAAVRRRSEEQPAQGGAVLLADSTAGV